MKNIQGLSFGLVFGFFLCTGPAFGQDALTRSGFKVMEDTKILQRLHFQDSLEFKISKERFSKSKSAQNFCDLQKSNIDTEFNALLIAMSGAANASKFLRDSITFEVKDPSGSEKKVTGIWQWSPASGKILFMYDGRGTDTEEVSVEDVSRAIKVQIPAICVKNLKK